MFEQLEIFRMAQGLARHAGARQQAVAQNVANVNTPGYRRVAVPEFAAAYARADPATEAGVALRATRAGHFGPEGGAAAPAARVVADARQSPNGNSVSLETEIRKAAELRRDHDMALSIYRSAMGILRTGIGRR